MSRVETMNEARWRIQVRNERGTVCVENTFRDEKTARANFWTLDFPETVPGVFAGWTKRLEMRAAGASRYTFVDERELPTTELLKDGDRP